MYVYNYLWLMYRVKYIIFSLTRTKAALASVTARAYFLQKLLQYLNRISPLPNFHIDIRNCVGHKITEKRNK